MIKKRAQAGTEYLIVVGFVTFAVMAIVVIAITMSNSTKEKLKTNELESFFIQLINSAESVFFSGEPSKSTVSLYLPSGVTNITIVNYEILVKYNFASGQNIRVFKSNVPLNGSISIGEGTKKLVLEAKDDYVMIS